jgi:hypothetical protein
LPTTPLTEAAANLIAPMLHCNRNEITVRFRRFRKFEFDDGRDLSIALPEAAAARTNSVVR